MCLPIIRSLRYYTLAFMAMAPLLSLVLVQQSVHASSRSEFNNASIKGTFVVAGVGTGGVSPEGGVGIFTFDGKGGVSGINIQNLPAASGLRTLVQSAVKGTYTVDENGTGMGSLTNKQLDGSIVRKNFDFVISKTGYKFGDKAAEEVSFMIRELTDSTGNLVTGVASRVPGQGDFALKSFQGTFSFSGFDPGSQNPAAGIGQITFDGKGNFTGFDILNVSDGSGGRTFFSRDFVGTYTVDKNGIYTAFLDSGDQAKFVMTKARLAGDIKIAEEYFYLVPSRNTATTGGFFITSIGKKLK